MDNDKFNKLYNDVDLRGYIRRIAQAAIQYTKHRDWIQDLTQEAWMHISHLPGSCDMVTIMQEAQRVVWAEAKRIQRAQEPPPDLKGFIIQGPEYDGDIWAGMGRNEFPPGSPEYREEDALRKRLSRFFKKYGRPGEKEYSMSYEAVSKRKYRANKKN